MLSIVSTIQNMLSDIERTGGARSESLRPSPELLQRIKQTVPSGFSRSPDQSALEAQLIDIQFEEHVRVCYVYLRKRGVAQDDRILQLLLWALEIIQAGPSEGATVEADGDTPLIHSLATIWRDMGDRQTYLYTVARNRALIVWKAQREQWSVTALGKVFVDLQPLQAMLFLLTIDLLFSTGEYDAVHISKEVFCQLRTLLDDAYLQRYSHHLHLLSRLGLFSYELDAHDRYVQTPSLTRMGRLVLDGLLSPDNLFLDTVVVAMETHDTDKSSDAFEKEIQQVLDLVDQSMLVDEDNRRLIRTSVGHYRSGDYIAALRVVYPSIEAAINRMVFQAGRTANDFRGLSAKADWLSLRGIIPHEIAEATEVVELRNRILHGNLARVDGHAAPFYQYVFSYVQRLLSEYHP